MKYGKNKWLFSVGLSLLLLILSISFIIAVPSMPESIWLLIAVINILAIGAVVVSYQKLTQNFKRIEALPKDYQNTLINAQEYLGLSPLTKNSRNIIYNMLIEIFEHSSIAGRNVNEVIDNNLSSYLDGFIKEYQQKSSFFYWASYSMTLFISYLLLMKVYKVIRVGDFSLELLQTETLDMGITLSYALIAFIFFPWLNIMMLKASKEQWTGVKRLWLILPLIIPIGLMMLLIVIDYEPLRNFLDYPLPVFTSIYSIGLGILLLILSALGIKYTKK